MMFGEQPAAFRLDCTTAELFQQGLRIITALQSHVTGSETGHPGLNFGFTGFRGRENSELEPDGADQPVGVHVVEKVILVVIDIHVAVAEFGIDVAGEVHAE